MSKIALTYVLLATLSYTYAQTCEQKAPPEDVKKMITLVGEWNGDFTDKGTTRPISIKFYIQDQELKAAVTNAVFPNISETMDVSLCSTDKFHFFSTRISGEYFVYNARLINGELVGTYHVGRTCLKENSTSFKMTKVDRGE